MHQLVCLCKNPLHLQQLLNQNLLKGNINRKIESVKTFFSNLWKIYEKQLLFSKENTYKNCSDRSVNFDSPGIFLQKLENAVGNLEIVQTSCTRTFWWTSQTNSLYEVMSFPLQYSSSSCPPSPTWSKLHLRFTPNVNHWCYRCFLNFPNTFIRTRRFFFNRWLSDWF